MGRRGSVVTTVMIVLTMLLTATAGVLAQEGTPAPLTFADTMGLPELKVQITDTAYEGLPAETPAGRYLLTVEATAAEGGEIGFMQLPEGMTLDDFMTLLAGPPAASPAASIGTPMTEAGPPEDEGGPPEWYYQTKHAGGVGGGPGQTVQAIIDLTPGEWIGWPGDPESPQAPVGLTVTGDAAVTPAAGAEPPASGTVTMFEYGFKVDGALTTGPQTIKVTNVGAQPHFMYLAYSPEPITKEQVGQILELDAQGATPAPDSGLPNPDNVIPVAYMATLSMGATGWVAADLQAGYYVMLCFIPDIESGMPHAFEGMYDVITIGVEGTPAP